MRRIRGRSTTGTPHPRGRSDRGAVLVETAFMLPFVLAILFGIIDFGFVFNDWVSVRQGGRDGLRQAIVNASPTNASSCTTDVAAYAKPLVCFTKDRVGLDANLTKVKIYFVPQSSGARFKAGQPVKVC